MHTPVHLVDVTWYNICHCTSCRLNKTLHIIFENFYYQYLNNLTVVGSEVCVVLSRHVVNIFQMLQYLNWTFLVSCRHLTQLAICCIIMLTTKSILHPSGHRSLHNNNQSASNLSGFLLTSCPFFMETTVMSIDCPVASNGHSGCHVFV